VVNGGLGELEEESYRKRKKYNDYNKHNIAHFFGERDLLLYEIYDLHGRECHENEHHDRKSKRQYNI